MVDSSVLIPQKVYSQLYKHLLEQSQNEQVAFLFAKVFKTKTSIQFLFADWHAVQPNEYESQSAGYVELKDEMRPKIIKMAADLNAALIEVHSHLSQDKAQFSWSDFQGFQDFVPHVWWRLKATPYAALVFSRSDFDGLVWVDNPKTPHQLTRITVRRLLRKRYIYPNGLTLKEVNG